jgi:hypothetical protein
MDDCLDHQDEAIDRLAGWVRARGLTPAVILLFEAGKPLSLIASQALLALQPVLGYVGPMFGLFDDEGLIADYAALFEDPANVDRLLVRLEQDSVG